MQFFYFQPSLIQRCFFNIQHPYSLYYQLTFFNLFILIKCILSNNNYQETMITPFILAAILYPVLSATQLNHAERWGYGILTSFALGMLGFVAAIILVQLGKWLKSAPFKAIIKFFFSLACGTLLGDAVIHILSEAYDQDNLNNYVVSLIFILALLGFLILEKVFLRCGISHEHWVQEEGNQHSHHHHHHPRVSSENDNSNKIKESRTNSQDISSPILSESTNRQSDLLVSNYEKDAPKPSCLQALKGKGSAGYLNLIGSTIHNTIDGLSIGLAFSTGISSYYVPVVVAIFIHEIPRQLGDVAILLKSRFTGWQTICSNGLINLLAVVGAIIGLSTSSLSQQVKDYIMVFVAGNFVYIASDIWKHLFNDDWRHNILEGLGFAIGVGAMFGIKFLQSEQEDGVGVFSH